MPLSNSQYDEIMREYDQRQLQDRRILDERRKEVFQKIPKLLSFHIYFVIQIVSAWFSYITFCSKYHSTSYQNTQMQNQDATFQNP